MRLITKADRLQLRTNNNEKFESKALSIHTSKNYFNIRSIKNKKSYWSCRRRHPFMRDRVIQEIIGLMEIQDLYVLCLHEVKSYDNRLQI